MDRIALLFGAGAARSAVVRRPGGWELVVVEHRQVTSRCRLEAQSAWRLLATNRALEPAASRLVRAAVRANADRLRDRAHRAAATAHAMVEWSSRLRPAIAAQCAAYADSADRAMASRTSAGAIS